jgi:hypothetical protein
MGKEKNSKSKNAVKAVNDQSFHYVNNYINSILEPRVEEPIKSDETITKETPCSSSSSIEIVNDSCSTEGCNKKGKVDCNLLKCYDCCVATSVFCSGHYKEYIKKKNEARWIEEGSFGYKKVRNLHHFEDKLEDYEQTSVIFCLKDFVLTKKYSDEIFTFYKTEERRKMRSLTGCSISSSNSRNNDNIVKGKFDIPQDHFEKRSEIIAIQKSRKRKLEKVNKRMKKFHNKWSSTSSTQWIINQFK